MLKRIVGAVGWLCGLGVLSPLQAATAVAVGAGSGAFGVGANVVAAEDAARLAMKNCVQRKVARDCRVVATLSAPGYGALALPGLAGGKPGIGEAQASEAEARQQALAACGATGEKDACRVVATWREQGGGAQTRGVLRGDDLALAEAARHWWERDYGPGFAAYLALAEKGVAEAQFQVGLAFEEGLGTDKSLSFAQFWLKRAVAQHHEGAGHALAALVEDQQVAAALPVVTSRGIVSNAELESLLASAPEFPTYQDLGRWIAAQGLSEGQRAWAVFRWVTDHINYDTDAFFYNQRTYYDAANVYRTRLTVCEGYANLIVALAKAAGVTATKVIGYAKGYGFTPGDAVRGSNHAWNAIWFDEAWHFLDATWAAGYVNSPDEGFVKEFKPFWWDTDPRFAVFSHLPSKPAWQLLNPTVSTADFAQLPDIAASHISALLDLGYDKDGVLAAMIQGDMVTAWPLKNTRARLVLAPARGKLRPGEVLEVVVDTSSPVDGALIVNDKFVQETQRAREHRFRLTVPGSGALSVSVADASGSYWPLLEYQVGE